MGNLIETAIRRPLSTLMVFFALVLLGVIAAANIGVSEMPEATIPKLVVSVSYPGMPAQEMRLLVTKVAEDALAGLRGLKHMESVTRAGSSSVTLEFNWGRDMRVAGVEARELVDSIASSLPEGCEKPQVLPVDPADTALMVLSVVPRRGDAALARRLAEREIRMRLQRCPGVGSVVAVGGRREEIQVEVDNSLMSGRSMDIAGVAQAVASGNGDYPAGVLVEGSSEYVVKAHGSLDEAQELRRVWIPAGKAGGFYLGDIARVESGFAERVSAFSVDGADAIALYVHRQGGASPIKTAAAVRAELAGINDAFGADLSCALAYDGSAVMAASVADLLVSGLAGILIAMLVLYLFVRDLPVSLIIMSSVPVAVLMTITVLAVLGKTVNLMSIGGLALGIGMMVDNSVVVLENIQRRSLGSVVNPDLVASATVELSLSNVGATGTALIVFMPVLFLPGVVGSVFGDLAIAVMCAQVASFVVSVSLVPVLFLLFCNGRERREKSSALLRRMEAAAARGFGFFSKRRAMLWGGLGLVAVLGAAAYAALPVQFMPRVDSGIVQVELSTAYGTVLDRSAAIAESFERDLRGIEGVASVFARCGGEADDWYYYADPADRSNLVHVTVMLSSSRRPAAAVVAERIASMAKGWGLDAQVSLPAHPVSRVLGIREGGESIVVGGADPREAASRLAAALAAFPDPGRAAVYPRGALEELRYVPDRQELARTGCSLTAVAQGMGAGLEGLSAGAIKSDGRDIPIRVRLRPEDRSGREAIGRIMAKSESGALVPIDRLGSFKPETVAPALYRYERMDAYRIDAAEVDCRAAAVGLAGVPGVVHPGRKELSDQMVQFALVLALVLVLLYLFLGAQLQSFRLPLIVMAAIPLSFGGIFVALLVGRSSINMDSLLGIIVLLGVVVNNAILLYESCQANLEAGGFESAADLVLDALRGRVRPIFMTSAISVISMVPLVLDGSGSSNQSSMALAVIGGLAASTILTVLVIPLLFVSWFGGRHG